MWTLLWGLFVPHSFVLLGRALRDRVLSPRRLQRLASRSGALSPAAARTFDYEEALGLLAARGCDAEAVRTGSIQDGSLRFIRETIATALPGNGPLRALHVGNFVGLSLASLTSALVQRDPSSLVVSIDPNIPHIGIEDPQAHTLALLARFGLQRNSLLVCGYTLEQTPGDNAVTLDGNDPLAALAEQAACESTLDSLGRLPTRFSVVVMDGHHDAAYLRRELALVDAMLDDGGLLFLDDVSAVWKGIRELFRELGEDSASGFEQIGYDGRIGALCKREGMGERDPRSAAVGDASPASSG